MRVGYEKFTIFSQSVAVSQKKCEIGPKLLLVTNRKSHTHFRLVPKSTTLDDLERPVRTLLQKRCVFQSHHKNLNEDRHIHQRQKCRPMNLISGITFMWIFARFPGEGRQTTGCQQRQFSTVRWLFL